MKGKKVTLRERHQPPKERSELAAAAIYRHHDLTENRDSTYTFRALGSAWLAGYRAALRDSRKKGRGK